MPKTKGLLENQMLYNGHVFTKDKKTNYYLSAKQIYNGKRIRLHRYIWILENGEIPKGYDIHHKDGDKTNNDIKNLVLLHGNNHKKYHINEDMLKNYDERKEKFLKYAHPAAKEWHKSKTGRKWHKEHWHNSLKPSIDTKVKKECICCGNTYDVSLSCANRSKFCSNGCKSEHRRTSKVDNIDKACVICGTTFSSNRYQRVATCSKNCTSILMLASRQKGNIAYGKN